MVKISKNILILKCLILLFIIFLEVISDIPVRLTNLKCNGNDTWLNITTCKIKAHSRTKRTIEIRSILKQPLHHAFVKFTVLKRYSGWKPWVVPNFTVNGCEFLAGKYHPILRFVKKTIKEKTSVNHTCPYLPGPLVVTDFDIREFELGSIVVPKGEYRVDAIVMESPQVQIGSLSVFVEFWEKN